MKNKMLTYAVVLLSLTGLSACSAVNNDVESLSEEDLQMAGQIIAESVSDENSGVMSNVYDALSDVGQEGIQYRDSRQKGDDRPNSGRGHERNYEYSYDPDTGTHTLYFKRSVERDVYSKEVEVLNKYIFADTEGGFIEFPKREKDQIESIYFVGNKNGMHNGPVRNAEFSRIDTLNFTGLHNSSSVLTMAGNHYGAGVASIETDSLNASRSYRLELVFTDIAIDKALVQENGNLEEGVTGSMTYSLIVNHTRNGEGEEKIIEGELEFEGDGTALLRFKKAAKVFRIFLVNGDVETDRPNSNRNSNQNT